MAADTKGRFKLFDRVRVRFGIDRGHYGTISHVGGDDGTYYGVKLDCHDRDVGYSDYELDSADVHRKPLSFGRGHYIPKDIAVCPECGGELTARAMQWDTGTGVPDPVSIEMECVADLRGADNHIWRQSDWQPVRDKITKWAMQAKETT